MLHVLVRHEQAAVHAAQGYARTTGRVGDDGFLRRAHCKIRRHNPAGDMLFIKGKVKRKFVEDGRALIDTVQQAHNQDGELSVLGGGIVELPRRA